MTEYRKKLIEVALPLEEINAACKADKARKTGTLRNLHKWFAPMPLPAWRALIYAALIDDPGTDEDRAHHLDLIKRLVRNGADLPSGADLDEAERNIHEQFPQGPPAVFDPFCGGGSTLVEAQRLGLGAVGSDLNPVPVLISTLLANLLPGQYGAPAMLEVADDSDLLPDTRESAATSRGLSGLESDFRVYSARVLQRATERLAVHYPTVVGETPTSWIWARTAPCANPVCTSTVVLSTSWWLSKKPGALAWVEPIRGQDGIRLQVVSGRSSGGPPEPPKGGRGGTFSCLDCGMPISESDLSDIATEQGLGLRMLAVVTEKRGQRIYRAPAEEDLRAAQISISGLDLPDNVPVGDGGSRKRFGVVTQADLYTHRQLFALATFAELASAVFEEAMREGADEARAKTLAGLMALAVGKLAHFGSSQTRWKFDSRSGVAKAEAAFGRNDIPMTWDFCEVSPLGPGAGSWRQCVETLLVALPFVAQGRGLVIRSDARSSSPSGPALVATDPPYFDAIGYADLSDYFYVWHRRVLRRVFPELYATVSVPKAGELTAIPSHHGNDRQAAREYFIDGFTETFRNLQRHLAPGLPLLVVYASKEQKAGKASEEQTRWASILTAMVRAGLEITGTWPIHGTGQTRMVGQGTNAVASYVVMACRQRPRDAGNSSLADFNRALRRELPPAIHKLQAAGILPVDLAQAAMGPGMQVYSRYGAVMDQTGAPISVEQALGLINSALAEVLDEQEGELDPESRFAVTWWDRYGWRSAPFGEADKIARPYGLAVDDLARSGVADFPQPGFVRLLGADQLDTSWRPSTDRHPTAWEAVHHLADRLIAGGGIAEAAGLLAEMGGQRDRAQALAYRLHATAARHGRTKDQERYNALIGSWSDLLAEAGRMHTGELF